MLLTRVNGLATVFNYIYLVLNNRLLSQLWLVLLALSRGFYNVFGLKLCRTFGGLVLGLLAELIYCVCVDLIKQKLNSDNFLDVFSICGTGGLTGTLFTAFLAWPLLS